MDTHMNKSLRVTDPDFAFIAASAAAEVDDLIHGRGAMVDNVTRLSQIIGTSVTHGSGQEAAVKTLMDPISSDVFSRAFAASYKYPVSSLDDLAAKASQLSQDLADVNTKQEMLEVLRDFCVELSKNALATRHTLHEARVHDPYKK